MGINRYFTPAQLPTGQDYFKLPFNELYTALGAKQKQQDEARAKNAELQAEADKVKALQPDQEEAFAINQKFKDSIDKLSNQDLTNPEGKMATRALIQMGREYFGPNGRATAINNNYNARALYEKKVDEYIKANKDVDPKYKEFAMNHFDEDYKHKGGIGQLNSNKSYNKYDTEDLAYVNVDAELEKAVKGNISDIIANSTESPDGQGYLVKNGNKTEYVTYEDIVAQASEKALADPSIGSHIKQGSKFGYYGQNDFDFKNAITTTRDTKGNVVHTPNNRIGLILDRLGRKEGFTKQERNKDVSSDATWIHNDAEKAKKVAEGYYDDIDAATWAVNPFGEDVANAGGFVSRLFGNNTPKYTVWTNKVNNSLKNYESLKSQVEANTKKGVTDIGLNEALHQAEAEYNSLQMINQKLEENFNAQNQGKKIPDIKMTFKDPEVQAQYDNMYKNKQQRVNTVDKAKYFEQNFDKIANQITTKQRGVKITDNDLYDREIQTGISSQKGKQVFGNNGQQLNADLSIPTGYVTQNSRGVMNLAYGYFSDEKEAKKAGVKVEELTGEEANADLNKSVKENKGLTVAVAQYPKDAKVYRVPVVSETTSYTKQKYSAQTYTPTEQKLANDLDYNVNQGIGGIIQVAPDVTLHMDSKSEYSPYVITVSEGGKQVEYRYKDKITAIKMAAKVQ